MSAPARQQPLPLSPARRPAVGRADFIEAPANTAALALIDGWRRWPDGRLALSGPEGAGKTHLAHVFMADSGAAALTAADAAAADPRAVLAAGAVAIEDGDRMGAAAEEPLFHLLNLAAERGAAVLLTGRTPPARWPVRLPDLASRLAAVALARLDPPDDALLAAVIDKAFFERGLRVAPDVAAYLAPRIERTFAAAQAVAARLDAEALAQRRPVTRRMAREVLA